MVISISTSISILEEMGIMMVMDGHVYLHLHKSMRTHLRSKGNLLKSKGIIEILANTIEFQRKTTET
jgi:hypothetical protein